MNWVVLDSDRESELYRVVAAHPDFIVVADDGHGEEDLLHLDAYCVSAVNHLTTLGGRTTPACATSGIIRCAVDAYAGGSVMRTTLNLDDQLLGEAQRLTGMTERTALIHEGLRALIQRESARRLARLGASEPSLRVPPRRRAARRKSA